MREEPYIVGWPAIVATLQDVGVPIGSRWGALRLAERRVHPLPVGGAAYRPVSRRSLIEAWVARELRRVQRLRIRPRGG